MMECIGKNQRAGRDRNFGGGPHALQDLPMTFVAVTEMNRRTSRHDNIHARHR
jgi:hypothetical protein